MAKVDVTSKKDHLYIFISVIVSIAAVFLYSFSFLPNSKLLSVAIVIVLLGLAIFFLLQTTLGKMGVKLWQEALVELRRVEWPASKEIVHTTLVVLVMVIVMSIIMWFIDSTLLSVVARLLGN